MSAALIWASYGKCNRANTEFSSGILLVRILGHVRPIRVPTGEVGDPTYWALAIIKTSMRAWLSTIWRRMKAGMRAKSFTVPRTIPEGATGHRFRQRLYGLMESIMYIILI